MEGFIKFFKSEEALVDYEYGIIPALVAPILLAFVQACGESLKSTFQDIIQRCR
ncbi:MAG: Flp family type IVb pilin [bacterium]